MGYNTIFTGRLDFTHEATAPQLANLSTMLGEDCRDHAEWGKESGGYIDLVLTDDFAGLRWNDATEKTYDLDKSVNVLIRQMRMTWPEFGLSGQLLAQGEDFKDRWALSIGEDGFAKKQKLALTGRVITCPHCEEEFLLEDSATEAR